MILRNIGSSPEVPDEKKIWSRFGVQSPNPFIGRFRFKAVRSKICCVSGSGGRSRLFVSSHPPSFGACMRII